MPTLTRRRDHNASQEAWLSSGDVQVGGMSLRSGNPVESNPWQWRCGFYPGSRSGECTSGTAASFEAARSAFMAAWDAFLRKRTESDFEEWREEQRWTERKYDAWARGEGVLVRP